MGMSRTSSEFDHGLRRRDGNHAPLALLSFLRRAEKDFPNEVALSYGGTQQTWAEHAAGCRRLASALARSGLRPGDVVALLMPNTPPNLAAHFAVPMAGGALDTIDPRLDADAVAYILERSGARLLFADAEFLLLARRALEKLGGSAPRLVVHTDTEAGFLPPLGEESFEDFVHEGDRHAQGETSLG
jgi:fatty-acyl-CoA synthase